MQIILVAGFGNLGAKLLPLRWKFPHLQFVFLEGYPGDNDSGYQGMKFAFDKAGTIGNLKGEKIDPERNDLDRTAARMNLLEFQKILRNEGLGGDNESLKEIFENHVYYCGKDLRGDSDEGKRYRNLIQYLIELDRSEVLLYLATRPDQYLWYLQRYAPFANRVAVDKPLATTSEQLDRLIRFSQLNPDLEIRPIDHYLFKLDFTEFNQALERRRGGLRPQDVQKIDVTIFEEGLDEHRPYFIDTGIIRDMMPHVSAMVRYLFRHSDTLKAYVGNVLPVVYT